MAPPGFSRSVHSAETRGYVLGFPRQEGNRERVGNMYEGAGVRCIFTPQPRERRLCQGGHASPACFSRLPSPAAKTSHMQASEILIGKTKKEKETLSGGGAKAATARGSPRGKRGHKRANYTLTLTPCRVRESAACRDHPTASPPASANRLAPCHQPRSSYANEQVSTRPIRNNTSSLFLLQRPWQQRSGS